MIETEEIEGNANREPEKKEDITPPEIEATEEIRSDDLAEQAQASAEYIDTETMRTIEDAQHRVQAAGESLSSEPEAFAQARQEYGLDEKLAAVAEEAGAIAGDAKTEIAQIIAEESTPNAVEGSLSPEEIKDQRFNAIMRELEAQWEAQNGPMHRALSEREIRQNQELDAAFGKEWDGRTARMTDAAMEFFFDFKGKGKNSVPSQAKSILAERFPEMGEAQETQPESATQEASKVENTAKIFEAAGIATKVVKAEEGGQFSDIIIVERESLPTERQVRLYRGINHLDGSVLEQLPYALRVKDAEGNITAAEDLRQDVTQLAENPTYENLKNYVDKMRPRLTDQELDTFNYELTQIQDGILSGYSARQELVFGQIKHGGGVGETGITPYVSATIDPYEAAKYGNEGLMIIDLPLSQFEAMNREVSIKGILDSKYITAIVSRNRDASGTRDTFQHEVYSALEKVYEQAPGNLYNDTELEIAQQEKKAADAENDKSQWELDVALVRQERADALAEQFPEVDLSKLGAEKSDVYKEAKTAIYDFYNERFTRLGQKMKLEDYDYQEDYSYRTKQFDRDSADDTMLLKLRAFVEHSEKRQAERGKA